MKNKAIQISLILFLGVFFISCGQVKKESDKEAVTESRESHARDYSEGEGEEDRTMLGIVESYNVEKNGVNLVLSYDANTSKFMGTVKNISNDIIKNVRVEIHLSNGKELGPTKAVDMAANESYTIELDASGEKFETWNAHAEVGSGEHGGESEEGHSEEEGEHDGDESEHS